MQKVEKKSKKLLTISEILKLDPSEQVQTIIKQGRVKNIENQMLLRVKKKQFLMARERVFERITKNVLNNSDYLRAHHKLTIEEFNNKIMAHTTGITFTKYDANLLRRNFSSLSEAIEFSFLVGYVYNIDQELFMYENLEYHMLKNTVSPFKYYLCSYDDIKILNKMTLL